MKPVVQHNVISIKKKEELLRKIERQFISKDISIETIYRIGKDYNTFGRRMNGTNAEAVHREILRAINEGRQAVGGGASGGGGV